jgi:hypothetical protein
MMPTHASSRINYHQADASPPSAKPVCLQVIGCALHAEQHNGKGPRTARRVATQQRGMSAETRAKISASRRQQWQDPKFRSKMEEAHAESPRRRGPHPGQPRSWETRQRISLSAMGRRHSRVTLVRMSASKTGRRHHPVRPPPRPASSISHSIRACRVSMAKIMWSGMRCLPYAHKRGGDRASWHAGPRSLDGNNQ